MLDFGALSWGGGDADDIETHGDVAGDMGLGIDSGEGDQFSLLAMIDRVNRGKMVAPAPSFDFDDDDGIPVPGYDVDLAGATAPVALENLITQPPQLLGGQLFAA
jgi:hypothetical protein